MNGGDASGDSTASIGRQRQQRNKVKADEDASGSKRFQCPRCPKSFSRIENLTRHQANRKCSSNLAATYARLIPCPDEEVGKFACVICRKRFTRSDLLNRHRKIHGAVVSPSHEAKEEHVTPPRSGSPPRSQPREYNNLAVQPRHDEAFPQRSPSGMEQDHLSQGGSFPPIMSHDEFQQPRSSMYGPPNSSFQSNNLSTSVNHQNQTGQGLTSLMEAALAPDPSAHFQHFSFTPTDNIDPSLWDGFLMFGDNPSSYMGAYDADISWTLNSQSEGSPNYFDSDMLNMDFSENPYQNAPPPYNHPNHPSVDHSSAADADFDDEDTNDWPDKVSGPPSPTRQLPLPYRPLLPVSWQPVMEEGRNSGLSIATSTFHNQQIQYVNDLIRTSLLDALCLPVRNEIPHPGINSSTLTFPPAEVLDYFFRLYLQHVLPRFPVVHLPTFNLYSAPPLLLVSMMFLGSSHSKSDRGRFARAFFNDATGSFFELQRRNGRHVRSILSSF